MSHDENYPTAFEWEAMIVRLPEYEAGTVRNLRLMVAALRQEILEDEAESDRHHEEDHAIAEAISKGSTEAMRWALGPETFNRFWGPELERLGNVMDEIRAENARLRSEKEESAK
jgi:hypothetical protein